MACRRLLERQPLQRVRCQPRGKCIDWQGMPTFRHDTVPLNWLVLTIVILTCHTHSLRGWLHVTNQDGVRDWIEGSADLDLFLVQFFGVNFVGNGFVDAVQE